MNPNSPEFRSLAVRLALSARLSPDQVEKRLAQAVLPSHWAQLNPDLNIEQAQPGLKVEGRVLRAAAVRKLVDHLSTRGYYRIEPLIDPALVESMRLAIERLRAGGWPAVFAYVYDEFWLAFRGPGLSSFLGEVLGEGYLQLPYVWAHYVQAGSSGWDPHVDSGYGLEKLSVWLPLSDATIENGCMYVVPRDAVPASLSDEFAARETFSSKETGKLLHASRPLPAAPGSLLGWGPRLIHWGGHSAAHAPARISLAVEFVRNRSDLDRTRPLLPAQGALPGLPTRLLLIAYTLRLYDRYEPAIDRFVPLADRILQTVGGGSLGVDSAAAMESRLQRLGGETAGSR